MAGALRMSELGDREIRWVRPILWIMFIHPFHLVLSALAHWLNREQAAIIEYLQEENRVLRDRFGPNRLRFTDSERRRSVQKLDYNGES